MLNNDEDDKAWSFLLEDSTDLVASQYQEALEFCKKHHIEHEQVERADLVDVVERLKMVDQGLGLNAEEASWALR